MLIPLINEESLRQSEVAAYDPFLVSSRMVLGSTFLYGASYNLGDEVFDGTYYHVVIANSPNTAPFTSGTTTPSWNPALGQETISGTVKFQNIGKSSQKYGRTDEVLMRIGYGSFAFVQIAFPRTITPSIGAISLVLTAPIFQMNSVSDVLLAPVVVYEPQALEFEGSASSDIVATGSTISNMGIDSMIPRYVGDVELSSAGSIRASGEIFVNGQLAPLLTEFVALPYAESNLTASLVKVRSGSAVMKSQGHIDTGSLVVGLVKQQFEPLDFESVTYPTIWPPDYLDDTKFISVGIPRFGEQVAIDLSDLIEPEREFYTLVIFRSSDTVWRNATITDGRLVSGDVKDVATIPILLGGDQSTDIQPYARPQRNPRTLTQALGGPYVGYIVDTYESETGQTFPIPWFDSTEAKRIALRMTETNFYSTEPGLETKIEYNASSQEFVVTQSDFRIIEGVAQNGIKTELQRISPVRIGSRLLYPIGSYEIPWLLAQTDYNPNPIIRLQGALPVTLSGSAVFTAVPT